MWSIIYNLFSYVIFFYTLLAMVCMTLLVFQSIKAQRRLGINLPDDQMIRYMLKNSPLAPKVAIIAPAFNEENTIKQNVRSLLNVYYPDFEVIVVNDGSTDKTLEELIKEYKLVQVPFTNSNKVPSKPITAVYRSTEPEYGRLVVVDKVAGGRKSDAANAGINICNAPYFLNIDVDCVLEPMALYRMVWFIVNSHDTMIGVGATMLISNGCTIEDGRVTKAGISLNPLPWFQQLEYMRSFLIGKMGWSPMNALPNISGGFGLFDTDVVVKSGGYETQSMAEDVDMLLRMVTYMSNTGQKFRVAQVPQVCCWTEGPFSISSLYRQRVRWARGLCEIMSHHRRLILNPHYGPIGAFTLPYIWLFEFIAPILETSGFVFLIWLFLIGAVNWGTALVIFAMIYSFSVLMTFVVVAFDHSVKCVDWEHKFVSYTRLILAGILEPFIYHPFITFCSMVGYINHLRGTTAVWKTIKRKDRGDKKDRKKDDDGKEGEKQDTK